jgi:hypothetical protein
MILEPRRKKYKCPLWIKETVKKRFNIWRNMSIPRDFECYYFKVFLTGDTFPLSNERALAVIIQSPKLGAMALSYLEFYKLRESYCPGRRRPRLVLMSSK